MGTIKFNLPGLYEHHKLNLFFMHYLATAPYMFNDGISIASVFGNFPFCIWDGGRNFMHYKQSNKEEIQAFCADIANFNAAPRLIFTNPAIQKEDLDDRFCNQVLKIASQYKGEVVINSDLMKEYIKTNYPNMKIISSTTKRISNPKKSLEEIENGDYFQVCIDYDLNKNMEFLESIPKEYRHKVEILVNAICPSNCKFRKQHYVETGKAHLSYLKHNYSVANYCFIGNEMNHPDKLGKGNNLSFDDIKKYNEMGFQYFKLEGRTLGSGVVFANYLYYLVKPEYHYLFIEMAYKENLLINNYTDSDIFEFKGRKEMSKIHY